MFRPKSPVQMLLDSTQYADKGIYMFVMSPEMHHSASLMLIKRKGGELALGSPDYSVYWNDQYEDDGGSIGRAVTDQIIASRLFELTEPRFSDPLDVKSGMSGFATQAELDASTYKADLGSPGQKGRKLRTRAAQQRCSNLVGMPIWRIMPL
jgi:hypothetical protein